MNISFPSKCYLLSYEDITGNAFLTPLTNVCFEQRTGEYPWYGERLPIITRVTAEFGNNMKLLERKDIEELTSDELLDLIEKE